LFDAVPEREGNGGNNAADKSQRCTIAVAGSEEQSKKG
jgi:hypothetical protein